jgi:putative selenium metabolism hydrolase
MKDKIRSAAESLRDDITAFLREIIAIPSVCGNEGAVIARLQKAMEDFGYDEVYVDAFGNLIGRIGNGKKLIAMDGHADTVDVGNPDNWQVDPFEGALRDDVIYGRGATDQKGGLASALFAGKILKELGVPDDVTLLVVASVYEEDLEGLCWRYIIEEEGIVPGAVLLTEPTNLRICTGQRGRMEIKVKTQGLSCHGSAPDRGVNAVYKMAPIIKDVEELHQRLESDSKLGKGSVTISDVRSTAPSLCAVADSCAIHLDRRLTEGETLETALQEIRDLPSVRASGAEVSVPKYDAKTHTGLVHPSDAYFPAWLMDRSHPLVRTAEEAYEAQFGEKAEVGVWQFSTNGVSTKGIHDIPSIGFGPAAEEYAHTPQDQVKVDDLVQAMAFYAAFVWKIGDRHDFLNE